MNFDYHIHTQFCNHARGSLEDYVKKALSLGFKEILFLDHLTLFEQDFKNSMTPKEVPLYLYSVRDTAEKFRGRIHVKCGLETDYHPDFFHETKEICEKFDFDMIGASVHFTRGFNIVSRSKRSLYSHLSMEDLTLIYLENISNMLDFNFFDTICHFDVIFKFGFTPETKVAEKIKIKIKQILDKASQKKVSIELNTSGYSHPLKRQYPDFNILKEASKRGISIVPASDAHHPREIGRDFSRAKEVLKKAGIDKLTGFSKREKYEIYI